MDIKEKAAGLSIISNTFLVIGKVSIGLLIGSVSVVSEGIHSALDLVAALIAFFAIRVANKPADEEHQYGHGKYENVSGTIEALLIFVAAIWIIYEAVHKLSLGGHVEKVGLGFIIMLISGTLNFFLSGYLLKVARETDSIALEADALHLRTDAYTSFGVVLGLVLIYFTGIQWIDPLVAIIVALMIIHAAWELTQQAFLPLVDARLSDTEENKILHVMEKYKGKYIEYHKMRTRKAGPEKHIDLHLVVPKHQHIEKVHDLCDKIEEEIEKEMGQVSVLIHTEPCKNRCEDDCLPGDPCVLLNTEKHSRNID